MRTNYLTKVSVMKCLLILLAGFEVFDGILTHLFVSNGLVQESNRLIATVLYEGNFLILKMIGAFMSIVALWYIYKRFPRMAFGAASCVVVFYSAVLAWNFNVIL